MKNLIKLPEFVVFDIPWLGRFNAELIWDTYWIKIKSDKKISWENIEVYSESWENIDTISQSFNLTLWDVLEIKYSVYVNIQ